MTDRLTRLLEVEARGLDVPAPATGAVLRQGRSIRRHRRMAVGAGGAVALAVVGGSVVALGGGDADQTAPDAASPAGATGAVFSYGNHVFYDGPGHEVEIDDKAVKSLYYSSAGVVVRHGNNPYSDGGGPQRFSLVTPEGEVDRLSLVTEETVHASDADQPFIAYGEAVDGMLELVVYDVLGDVEEARVPVGPTNDTWFPVALDDGTAYVQDGYQGRVHQVDWRTGKVTAADIEDIWTLVDGLYATQVDGAPAVVDAATGDVVLSADGPGTFDISPDGRYADLVRADEESMIDPTAEVQHQVYDLETGSSATFPGPVYEWGWTPEGDLFRVAEDEVTTCDSATGACATEPLDQPSGPGADELKLGGRTYES